MSVPWGALRTSVGVIHAGVVALVSCVAITAVVAYFPLVSDVGREASRNSSSSYVDREIAGGNGLVADQAAVYAAQALIPKDSTYHVAVGSDYAGGDELTRDFVTSYYGYFLMPRRSAEGAPWIICYGCELSVYGPGATVVWKDDQGISIVKAAR